MMFAESLATCQNIDVLIKRLYACMSMQCLVSISKKLISYKFVKFYLFLHTYLSGHTEDLETRHTIERNTVKTDYFYPNK